MAYLSAIEGEAFGKLPAAVYVRGFLAEYARALGLDGERVKQTYLARFWAARGPSADDEHRGEHQPRRAGVLERPDEDGAGVRKGGKQCRAIGPVDGTHVEVGAECLDGRW